MPKEQEITFLPVTQIFHTKECKEKWIKVYAMSATEEEIKIVREHIQRGEEAVRILTELKAFYRKEL